jgi:cytochrome c-type biogenesis protein
MAPLKAGGVLVSEFVSGLLLGIVWTPCSGPSLGAALGLAGQAASATQAC